MRTTGTIATRAWETPGGITRIPLDRCHFGRGKKAETSRLFECIGMKRKGSPRGKIAEIGCSEPTQKPQTGEPNEHLSLYRIRRPQENHQLLHQDCRRADCRGRQAGGVTSEVKRMGDDATTPVAGRDGGNSVQRLDL